MSNARIAFQVSNRTGFVGQYLTREEADMVADIERGRVSEKTMTRGAFLVWERSGFKATDWVQC